MRDLAVIGGGFWGTATAVLAARAGLNVIVFDDVRPGGGSRAASGYIARSWWKTREERARLDEALTNMASVGAVVDWAGADVIARDGARSSRADWATFRPEDLLSAHPRTDEKVLRVSPGLVHTVTGPQPCRAVVLAAGAWTDELLIASGLPPLGVRPLAGRGVLLSGCALSRTLMRKVTPYHSWCARPWEGGLRVGETTETGPRGGRQVEVLLNTMLPLLPGALPVGDMWGLRPTLAGGPLVREVAPRVVAATGGGRVGATLAWWAARRALALAFPGLEPRISGV